MFLRQHKWSFRARHGHLMRISSERQESSSKNKSGEKMKKEGIDNA